MELHTERLILRRWHDGDREPSGSTSANATQ